MLVVIDNHDKELCVAKGNECEEAAIVSEHTAAELCEIQQEQKFVAVENKEEPSLVYTDKLPGVAVEQKDVDPLLLHSNESPVVALGSKDIGNEELPTVLVENRDDFCEGKVEIIEINHLTDSAICEGKDELATVVIDNAQTHSPNIVMESCEEQSLPASCREKYLVPGTQDEPKHHDELHPVAVDDKGILSKGDDEQFGEEVIMTIYPHQICCQNLTWILIIYHFQIWLRQFCYAISAEK